jgi:phosphatidylserine/phosphatidylglycerophosphate/cardiolipin synthase-like enzyme
MLKRLTLSLAIGLVILFGSLMLVGGPRTSAASSTLLIDRVYYDTYFPAQPEEAFRLSNISTAPISLTDWIVADGEGVITLTGSITPGAHIWIARTAISFTLAFGYSPTYEYGGNSDPAVPDLIETGDLSLADAGDQLILKENTGAIVDAVVWETGALTGTDWDGSSIEPYTSSSIGAQGQILYRQLDQRTGQPVPDTNTAADWAQSRSDDLNGKKVLRPGWELDRYFQTARFTETTVITYLIAPDHLYENVRAVISQAQTSIRYEGYTFDNADLGVALAARAAAGVSVTVLLEGGPVGGLSDQEKWICQQIENAGGQCWFFITDTSAAPPIHARYAQQHAKVMLVDDRWLLTGSENLNYTSMPADDKADGTKGNRGLWLWTEAGGPLGHLRDVFDHDLDPSRRRDVKRWSAADPVYGAPPLTYTVNYTSGGTSYTVQFTRPIVISGHIPFEIVQSPENALRAADALLGMIAHASSGSRVLAEQLYEYKYWGVSSSSPITDPNPRLEAYIAAARRGAIVDILLDAAYDDPLDPRGNTATCAYVNAIAAAEQLNLACLLGNPTGTGLHNKMVLVTANDRGWVHTGSLNGSENSSKQNREVAVQVESLPAYEALAQVFWADWLASGGTLPPPTYVYLPLITRDYTAPTPPPPPASAWLDHLNSFRALVDLPDVTENLIWSDGDWKHARYMVKNNYVGHSEDPANPWYTPEGLLAAQKGNVFVSSSTATTDTEAIDWWMSAPFHAVAVVDPALQQVGYGSYREADGGWQMGATLDVARGQGTIPATTTFPVAYPGDGKESVLRAFEGGEWPDPLTSCPGYSEPAGLPIILQIGPGNLTPSVTAHTLMSGTISLEHCLFDETSYANPVGSTQTTGRNILNGRDAIVLMPRQPLTPGATYTVSISANGQTYTWSFSVSSTARALEAAQGVIQMR